MQEWISIITPFLEQYGYVIVFLGTILGGELVILAAVFLASLGLMNVYLVILIGLIGVISSDSFWYYLGRKTQGKASWFSELFLPTKYKERIQIRTQLWKNKFNNHYAKFLIIGKFVYGTRIVTLLLAGNQKIPYKKFLIYNITGSVLWLAIVVFLGYVMGLSWNYLDKYNSQARYLVLFGLLLLFVLRYVFKKVIHLGDGKRS